MFPQTARFNVSDWKIMENEWARKIGEGYCIEVAIFFKDYVGVRPSTISVKWSTYDIATDKTVEKFTGSRKSSPTRSVRTKEQAITTRDQLIQKLGAAILNDEGLMEEPWKRLVLIVKFFETSSRLKGVAILESGDDAPVASENTGDDGVAGVLKQLRKVMAKEDKSAPFVACLIRVAKDGGEMDIDFEHKNRDRWDYDPRDRADMRAKLKLDD